jgi:hypothetical protein
MLDAEWTRAAIATHFDVDVKEVEQAIVKEVKSERNQDDDQRRGKQGSHCDKNALAIDARQMTVLVAHED